MIPVNEPVIGERELEYVQECLRTGWISSAGRFIEAFEAAWAQYCGMQHGIAVSNGTVALQLALRALDLRPGDEVILPAFTIISCALAAVYNDLVPVLVDADPRNWCMDVRQVESRLTDRTRVILAVHTYGHPVDMDALTELARNHNLLILEDAAEAHGAEYLTGRNLRSGSWRRCGALGDLSTFSFYANKPVTTGEGGMVLTRDSDQAAHLRSLRNLSFGARQRFEHAELGFNFRLTNLQAALGLAQVERIDEIIERKRWIGAGYQARLAEVDGLQLPVEEPWARQVYWMYGIVLEESTGLDALEFARRLEGRGVQTRPFFLGMHQQPALQKRGLFAGQRFPVTERLSKQGLYLPSGLSLTEGQIDTVCAAIRGSLA